MLLEVPSDLVTSADMLLIPFVTDSEANLNFSKSVHIDVNATVCSEPTNIAV